MAFKPTPEQERIINARNTSLLVSAAAGSGKTAVLVERIVSIVCDEKEPVDIDRILVVTFTQAAAAEMKERILKRINEKLDDDPDNEHLQRQITLVHRALITTIDSFCLDVIRNHFQDADIEPDFRVCDEGESRLISVDVMAKVLEEAYDKGDQDFLECVEAFCPGSSDNLLEDMILSLSRTADSYPWPLEYLEERKQDHNYKDADDFKGSDIERAVLLSVLAFAESALKITEIALSICEDNPEIENYMDALSSDRDYFESLIKVIRSGGYIDVSEAISTGPDVKVKLKAIKKSGDPEADVRTEELKKIIQKYRSASWGEIEKAKTKYFSFPLGEHISMINGCAGYVNALIDVTIEYKKAYTAEKVKRHVVDFSDLSHLALDILTTHKNTGDGLKVEPTDAAIEYRNRFVQVMTDEYQDSNLIQEIILTAVSGEDIGLFNRFIVGDVKQSIYGFRQARPDLFIEKQNEYSSVPPHMEIDLSGNFRSRSRVIDSVNRVFERIMHEEICGIEYDEKSALIAKATYPENDECRTELILYDNRMMEDMAESYAGGRNEGDGFADGEGATGNGVFDPLDLMEEPSDKSELEALIVATKIKQLMESAKVTKGEGDNASLKKISYRDIVILRRSVSGVAETYRRVFASMGIPIYAEGKNGYFKAPEVSLILQYLRVLSNPLDDIPLYSVLRSDFGGFNEDEIALIRFCSRNKSLYESLLIGCRRYENDENGTDGEQKNKVSVNGSSKTEDVPLTADLKEKIGGFLDTLSEYRDMSRFLTVRQLLDRVISGFKYMEICAALPGGSGRAANVQMLLVMASNYEKSSFLGLNDFIRYIDNMEKFEVDSGEAGSASDSEDVVRLMTIHKSKGLEFPYVIFAGMGRGFNFMDLNKPLLIDNSLGMGCRFVDTAKRIRVKTLRQCAISDKLRRDAISEEMRLFYVAMTRAKEKLIMLGGLKDLERRLAESMDYPSESLSLGAFQSSGCYLDLLLPVLGCREVKEVIDISVADAGGIYSKERQEQESLAFGQTEFALTGSGDLRLADMDTYDRLIKKFSYVYPYSYFENLYSKTTVSELKMAAMAERDEGAYNLMEHGEDETARPVFAGGNVNRIYDQAESSDLDEPDGSDGLHSDESNLWHGNRGGDSDHRGPGGSGNMAVGVKDSGFVISGTERGNAYHRTMQLLSWDRILGRQMSAPPENYEEYRKTLDAERSGIIKSITAFLDEENSAGHISDKTKAAINPYKILSFLTSELSFRMWRADRRGELKREQPFVYGIPASRLLDREHKMAGSEALDKELLIIQGIIDAYFFEEGNIILLDYKTDAVSSMGELWLRYETQMDYYREALESLEGACVSERHLYSFKLNSDRDYGV